MGWIMKETPVFEDGQLLGWYARVSTVFGVWTSDMPHGFMIKRNTMPLSDYLPTVYKTRGEAKRALQIKLVSHNII